MPPSGRYGFPSSLLGCASYPLYVDSSSQNEAGNPPSSYKYIHSVQFNLNLVMAVYLSGANWTNHAGSRLYQSTLFQEPRLLC